MLDSFFNAIFGPILRLQEPFALFIISFILTIITTLVYKFFTDQNLMKQLKEDMKSMQDQMKDSTQTEEKKLQLQKTMLEKNMVYMKHSMKPTLITFIPIIITFGWLRNYYTALGNPKIFFGMTWIWSYLIFSIAISMLARKLLNIH